MIHTTYIARFSKMVHKYTSTSCTCYITLHTVYLAQN